MRRLAGVALVLLAACGNSDPGPPAASATSATTAATSAPATSAATSAPTTTGGTSTTGATSPPTSAATSGPTSSGGTSEACAALTRLDNTFKQFVADYDDVRAAAEHVLQVSTTLSDQGQAVLLATIATDAKNAADAFQGGDLAKGARLQNRVVRTIPPAQVALGCT